MRELSIAFEFERAIIHVAIGLVGIALFDERFHQFDDLVDGLGGARVHVGRQNAQTARVDKILVNISLRHLFAGQTLFIGLFDDLVIDIRKVLHKGHLISPIGEIPAQTVEHDEGAGVSNVKIVVYGWAAGID